MPRRRTKYGDKDAPDKVWKKAEMIGGADPKKYRQDPYGNKICKQAYGKKSQMGWEIDHIKPKSKGGSDDIVNLQALKTKTNKYKGDSLVKKSRHSKN